MLHTDHPLSILLVDDDRILCDLLTEQLQDLGHRVRVAQNASHALVLFLETRPDLVLLDVVMPQHDGYWLARQLREREQGWWTPIIFLSAHGHEEDFSRGIESGGDDYLVKPVSMLMLSAKLRAMNRLIGMQRRLLEVSEELRNNNRHLQHLSEHDTLTGLINRRGFDARLARAIAAARRNNEPLTLMLCDVDHFKDYNDTLGHSAGDLCLKQVAQLMQKICRRPTDDVARYGGEEFALILPDTPKLGAMQLARSTLESFASAALPHPSSTVLPFVTISGGMTTCIPDHETSNESLLLRADEALYVAKAKGRNRFFSFEMQLDSTEPDRPSRL